MVLKYVNIHDECIQAQGNPGQDVKDKEEFGDLQCQSFVV